MTQNQTSRWALTLGLTLAVAALGACAPTTEETTADDAASALEEIPVTTASEAARELWEEGLYLSDVGRIVEAREKFQAAVADDPGFVRGHFAQSNAALSFAEFQQCLDAASENLDAVSDGEKMLVEINRTFLTNDNQRGVELAQQLTAPLGTIKSWLRYGLASLRDCLER